MVNKKKTLNNSRVSISRDAKKPNNDQLERFYLKLRPFLENKDPAKLDDILKSINWDNAIDLLTQNLPFNKCYASKMVKSISNESQPPLICYDVPSYKEQFNGDILFCIHCDKLFSNTIQVKNHLGTEHDDPHYFCENCGGKFSTTRLLLKHQNVYKYNCDHCDYATNRYRTFRIHNNRIHHVVLPHK